jgi:superoxide dismutase
MVKKVIRLDCYGVLFYIILRCKDQKIFNNAGQHWNHSFYWYCMTPEKT